MWKSIDQSVFTYYFKDVWSIDAKPGKFTH